MRHSVQQGRSHFAVAEDLRPFAEVQVRGDNHRDRFVQFGQQVKEELAAVAGKREVTKLVQNQAVDGGKLFFQ